MLCKTFVPGAPRWRRAALGRPPSTGHPRAGAKKHEEKKTLVCVVLGQVASVLGAIGEVVRWVQDTARHHCH